MKTSEALESETVEDLLVGLDKQSLICVIEVVTKISFRGLVVFAFNVDCLCERLTLEIFAFLQGFDWRGWQIIEDLVWLVDRRHRVCSLKGLQRLKRTLLRLFDLAT